MKVLPEILIVVIQLALCAIQFVSSIRNYLFVGDKDEALRTILPLQITVLIIYVVLRGVVDRRTFSELSDGLKQAFSEVSERIDSFLNSVSSVKTIHQDEFYRLFGTSIRSAKNSVAIAHLDTHPPALVGTTEPSYYKELASQMKSRPYVRFRRVERLTAEKIPWIGKLIQEYRGLKNVSLGCIDLGTAPRKPPHVSVQLIDDYLTFLVAVAAHYPHSGNRDVIIQDKAANTIWVSYYDTTLWNGSIKLIENGDVNEETWSNIRKSFNA